MQAGQLCNNIEGRLGKAGLCGQDLLAGTYVTAK
jgi:hypothetical protein